ncbi:MAG: hypothetical protein EPO00_10585 [Chloroflexota bacterium]|nr:MAG: hypothetical protein EPO00_10585 [Chloroflexota bacterium]
MTATTAQDTWTEAEIREALTEFMPGINFDVPIEFVEACAPLGDSDMARVRVGWDSSFTPRERRGEPHPGTLWADLRPTEVGELQRAMDDVYRAAAPLLRRDHQGRDDPRCPGVR